MSRILALIFLAGLLLGVAGTVVIPRVLGPYVPGLPGGPEEVTGRVSGKLREDGRLLVTIETDRGNALATFTERVQEIDLLVSAGDTVVMSVAEYSPFVENPRLVRVASPPGAPSMPPGSAVPDSPEPSQPPPGGRRDDGRPGPR